eukprot:COSAG04_NODE_3051_length_3234_cov_1.805742_2_plen_321_part_00
MRKRSNRAGCVERDVTASGTPTATAPGHQGDISLLQDGVVPAPGSQNDAQQYDTYTGDGGVEAQSIGYSFDSMQMLTKLTYTEGMHFSKPGILLCTRLADCRNKSLLLADDGGWWTSTPVVEVNVNGAWVRAEGQRCFPRYDGGNPQATQNYETFVFSFDAVEASGIRLSGTAGGSNHFLSVGEIRVSAGEGALPASPPLSVLAAACPEIEPARRRAMLELELVRTLVCEMHLLLHGLLGRPRPPRRQRHSSLLLRRFPPGLDCLCFAESGICRPPTCPAQVQRAPPPSPAPPLPTPPHPWARPWHGHPPRSRGRRPPAL